MNRATVVVEDSLEFIQTIGKNSIRFSLLERDSQKCFDRDIWMQLGQAGMFQIHHGPETIGLFLYTLAKNSLDIPLCVSAVAHIIATEVIARYGSLEQRKNYLVNLCEGVHIGAICNSEPSAGTDIKAIQSKVELQPNEHYFLSLKKHCSTNLGLADTVLCSAWLLEGDAKPSLEVFVLPGSYGKQASLVETLCGFKTGLTGSYSAHSFDFDMNAHLVGERQKGYQILLLGKTNAQFSKSPFIFWTKTKVFDEEMRCFLASLDRTLGEIKR